MSHLALDERGNPIQAIRPGATTKQAAGTSAATTAAFTTPTRCVRIASDVDCFIAVGPNPTATTSDMPVFSKQPEVIAIADGDKISVITATGTGSLYITLATDFAQKFT